ncbi:hypothetical protein TNIN_195861 [Trichonephila inaurata madagascariensis]|uniref:Uncharacterized protein n=1 Tax=Trichonephila inaurata madagascariensis TaxID=2747483 RepID=A0A8X6XHD5_9ARAC|nr:hypothetical protein TNIN_195861 [Trichonephila inaurata madagascariensis]
MNFEIQNLRHLTKITSELIALVKMENVSGMELEKSVSVSQNLEEPRLDRSQGLRGSESSEKLVEKGEKTSVAGNKSGRREHWLSKRKQTSGLNESSVGLRQPAHKKRPPEVRKFKRGIPSSLSENQDSLQTEQYKPRRDPSSSEETSQGDQVPTNLRRRHQSRQGGQDPDDSLASRRSSSFEVHIGDIAER